jgi:hypothetical protein
LAGKSGTVAVIIPLPAGRELTADEHVSLWHAEEFLAGYDRYLLAPEGLEVERPGYRIARFPGRFFGDKHRHNRLLIHPLFYEAFAGYEYILIYHLDSLVFSDQLAHWCARGYDYVAPVRFDMSTDPPTLEAPVTGGFSLRRVDACLRVLRSRRAGVTPREYWRGARRDSRGFALLPKALWALAKFLPRFNSVDWELKRQFLPAGEDNFWAIRAHLYDPGFRRVPVGEALAFGWGLEPRYCYQLCDGKPPFGCHGWNRPANREFWIPFLLKDVRERSIEAGSALRAPSARAAS